MSAYTNPVTGEDYHFDKDYGGYINSNHERVARIINEYDPNLELVWIPPGKRDEADAFPYAIVSNNPDGSRTALSFWTENEIDERLIEWCFLNDFTKHSPIEMYDAITNHNAAVKLMEAKIINDAYEEKKEFMKFLTKSPLHTIKHGGRKYR